MFIRVLMYAVRSSDGNSSGRGRTQVSFFSSDFFSSCVCSGVGFSINVGCIFVHTFLIGDGTGTVINGFFVRTINVVVATYSGRAANIRIPNTNPGNPRNSARIKWRQYASENMSKLNRKFSIAHITAV